MMRFLAAAILLVLASGLPGCGPRAEDDRMIEVIERAAFLFKHYTESQQRQDPQMFSVVRSDLRRLNQESFEVLVRALASKDQEVQGYAAFTLGFSANRGAIAPLALATQHSDETVRGNAIAALGQLGFVDAPVEPFQRLPKDPLPDVRQAALFGLASLVSPKSDLGMLDAVHLCFEDPDVQVRAEALLVVRKLRRKESVAPLLAGPLKDSEPQVRASAALALAAIGRDAKAATPFLVELLKDEIHRVVEAAWVALNKIHEKDLDRSYSTWRDWYEDEQKVHYICFEHKEVSEPNPGTCPKCQVKLERITKEPPRKPLQPVEPPPAAGLYVCPEHSDILTTTPAKCGKPGCGKDLVPKKPDPVNYVCPDHPDVMTLTPAKCGKPGCGKDLVPKK
ncbi:MAG: HEAT repeat domain-containing protein [Planctomycetes bacterium]|nr:HEAT repeat domain-containing protein [Planctomycetota bacterium]